MLRNAMGGLLLLIIINNVGGSHGSDIIICLNGSLRGITNHV